MSKINVKPRTDTGVDDRKNYLDDIEESGTGDDYALPTQWTDFWAGSAEKIDVMRKRLECGEQLYHPFDCKAILASSRSG